MGLVAQALMLDIIMNIFIILKLMCIIEIQQLKTNQQALKEQRSEAE